MTIRVIGVGNPYRRDDGVGLAAVELLRKHAPAKIDIAESSAEPSDLFAAWRNADKVILLDAAAAAGAPGKISRLVIGKTSLPPDPAGASTHAFGVAAAIGLAEALGDRPPMMTVFAVEGLDFSYGEGLSIEVAAALPELIERIIDESNRLFKKDTVNA